MLLQLQCYNVNVVNKPGPEMYVSDNLSVSTAPCRGVDTPCLQHAVCIMGSMQAEYSQLDREQQADVTAFSSANLPSTIKQTMPSEEHKT
jgi:hypothetical protein